MENIVGRPFVPPPTVEDEIEKTEGDFEIELRKLIMKHSGTSMNGYKSVPASLRDKRLVLFIHSCLIRFLQMEQEQIERLQTKVWKSEKGGMEDEDISL